MNLTVVNIDWMITGSAIAACAVFVAAHLLIFRFLTLRKILTWIMRIYVLGAAAGAAVFAGLSLVFPTEIKLDVFSGAGCFLLSLAMYTFMSFAYILCVFGPYESSIRLRLMLELYDDYPEPVAYSDLLTRYNPRWILDCRLQRLIGSSEVVNENGLYRTGRIKLAFLLIEYTSRIFKKIGNLRTAE